MGTQGSYGRKTLLGEAWAGVCRVHPGSLGWEGTGGRGPEAGTSVLLGLRMREAEGGRSSCSPQAHALGSPRIKPTLLGLGLPIKFKCMF